MCGILGVRQSLVPDRARVEAALHRLAWRGPDDRRLIAQDGWWLGVTRLAISDPDAAQPVVGPDGAVVLFNGAVTSARAEREQRGHPLRSGNDAELWLHRSAAGDFGISTGPFAVARLAAGRLTLARDRLGEKPLFVLERGAEIAAFASAPSALAALGLGLAPGDEAWERFLRYGVFDRWQAPPGFRLRSDWAGVLQEQESSVRHAPHGVPAVGAAGVDFATRVQHAVERCLDAEVPVGLALSGGLDSSCIALCAADAGRRLPALQFRAQGTPGDERRLAESVCAQLGHPMVSVDGGPEVLEALPRLTDLVGMPLGDPSVLAAHAVARRAAAEGLRVLLSGEGADDLMLGYDRDRLARWLPARGIPGLPAPAWSQERWARSWRCLAARRPWDVLLEATSPGLRRALGVGPDRGGAPDLQASTASRLERARAIEREFYLRKDLLPKLDTALMAAGVEGRCPFLDLEVLAAPELRGPARSLLGKRPLRDGLVQRLPNAVKNQRKRGFGLPLDDWLRRDGFIPDLLRSRGTLERGIWDATGLTRLLDAHRSGRRRAGRGLYLVAAYECWLRSRSRESA